jgi:acylphosphatase
MESVARRVVVSGVVQGVGFRHHTKLRARELGLSGWVRNRPDGNVEAWIEGPEETVGAMIEWLRRGPGSARVEDVAVETVEPRSVEQRGDQRFSVRFD